MMRLYLKFTVPVICLLTVFMVIIHAEAYDDHGLRALLIPPNCEMPCFMGIRPGVTTVDEAMKLLEESGWVATVEQDNLLNIRWTWSGSQPNFILSSRMGSLFVAEGGQRVSRVVVHTTTTLGDVWLMLGTPVGHELGYIASNNTGIFYSLRYEKQQVLAAGYGQVCAPFLIYWNPITELDIGLARPFIEVETNSFSHDVRSLKKLLC